MDIKVNNYNSQYYQNAVYLSLDKKVVNELLANAFKINIDLKVSSDFTYNLSWDGDHETSITIDQDKWYIKYTYSNNKFSITTFNTKMSTWQTKVFKLIT